MLNVLIVGLGGFFGAIARYLVGSLFFRFVPTAFPFGTLTINFVGAILIGMISEYSLKITPVQPLLYLFITIGILGGFTTFSTFSLETVNLFESGKIAAGLINVIASVMLCLLGVVIGKYMTKLF